jgi:outer membrane biosynthesis protein TonB
MFDSIVPPKRSRKRQIFFAVSGVAHGAALAALIVGTMWRIDKLGFTREPTEVTISQPILSGDSGGGNKPKPRPATATKPKPHRIKVTVPVQPPTVHTEETPTTDPSTDTSNDPPGTGGGGDGKGSGEPTIGQGCLEGASCGVALAAPEIKPCSDPSRANDPDCVPPPHKDPPIVVVENLRVSGETQIQPDDDVKIMMMHAGQSHLHVSFKVCLDASGAVTSSSRMGSTGYAEYDAALAGAIATWRYRPYSVNGQAIAVCGPVTFNFTLRRE